MISFPDKLHHYSLRMSSCLQVVFHDVNNDQVFEDLFFDVDPFLFSTLHAG